MTSPPESAYGLWYYPKINRFVDEDGNILHDLCSLFDVWQLVEWRKTRTYGILTDKKGDLCELYYLDPSEEPETEFICMHNCAYCKARLCEIYELWRDWKFERSYM